MTKEEHPFGVLYIDDESMSLKYFSQLFEDLIPVFTADNPIDGYQIFLENESRIGLVLSDQKMPQGTGIELLTKIKAHNPRVLRVLVTAYTDLNTAVQALNDGLLYSYLSKPWDPEELEGRILNALDYYSVSIQRDNLLKEKSLAFQQLSMADKASTMNILSCGLNHHMRNALTAVNTFLELTPLKLEEELGGPPADDSFWVTYYDQVHSQIDRMTGILTNLWEASNSSDLEVSQNIDLVALFRDAGTLTIGNHSNINVSVNCLKNSADISGDLHKLNQMARLFYQEAKTNLIDGGEIEVNITEDPNGQHFYITFIDNGPAIEEDNLNCLFDPFFVRADRPDEFGMNLVACYLTVYHHGGTMDAKKLPDGRNAIRFSLPKVPIPPEDSNRISREVLRNRNNASKTESAALTS